MGLHEEITNRIVEDLQEGFVPWVQPWTLPLPYNAVTNSQYHGVNVLLLWNTPYQRPAWMTFKQAGALGGHVRRGERSTPIVYVSRITKFEDDGERPVSFLARYSVFNVEQIDNLP